MRTLFGATHDRHDTKKRFPCRSILLSFVLRSVPFRTTSLRYHRIPTNSSARSVSQMKRHLFHAGGRPHVTHSSCDAEELSGYMCRRNVRAALKEQLRHPHPRDTRRVCQGGLNLRAGARITDGVWPIARIALWPLCGARTF